MVSVIYWIIADTDDPDSLIHYVVKQGIFQGLTISNYLEVVFTQVVNQAINTNKYILV
jgi:hypothetical protein